jgi:hypothetical protein
MYGIFILGPMKTILEKLHSISNKTPIRERPLFDIIYASA